MSAPMSAARWSRLVSRLLSLGAALALVLGASVANAQVFKPRGKAGKTTAAARKNATAVPSKQPTRATAAPTPRRGAATAPAKKARNTSKVRDDDVVIIDDEDDDDVKITDDE
jgi:hypothetical protein